MRRGARWDVVVVDGTIEEVTRGYDVWVRRFVMDEESCGRSVV